MAAAVDAFIEVTGWKQSRESAQQYIDAAGGSIEAALSVYFEDPRPAPPPPRPAAAAAAAPRRSLVEELNDEYTRELVTAKAPRITPHPDLYVLRLPLLLALVMYPIGKLVDLCTWAVSGPAHAMPPPPAAAAEAHFKRNVVPALALRDDAPPPAHFLAKHTYLEAVELAKRELKYLLVVLTSDVHDVAPQDFIAQLLATGLPFRSETLVWFGSVARSEGYRVALGFGATQLPFVVLIAASPRTAQSSTIVMESLLSHAGPLDAPDDVQAFVRKADEVVQMHEPKLLALRLERRRFDADRELRDQQDSAYQQSLETDRRRAEEAKQRQRDAENHARLLAAWRRQVFSRAARYAAESTAGARVGLRLPSGQRLTLHFPESAPVSDIYDVTYARLRAEDAPEPDDAADDADSVDLSGFEPPYGFVLKSPVLRKAVPATADCVRDEPAVWPNGVLVVDTE